MKNKELKDFIYNNVYQNASNGYVLTSSELASEMVSTLPESVFKSTTTTFLDPICKSGTFLFEIVEKLYSEGHSISNIESRIYTIDSNFHSLNVANSFINKIMNKESGVFKVDYKSDFVEKSLNRLVNKATKGKFKTLEDFFNIILLDKKDKYLMVELKNAISEFIEKYEKVSKLESKLFGEVFTPRQLIDEMLDTLPEEVWKDPNRKWLDPAVGIGNFPAAIMDRLMFGLEEAFPNDDDRRKHILEEMLYMCDISTKNLFLLYMLFDKNNEFKLNVYRGSFLEEGFDKHMKEVWGLERFDFGIGNPPYQASDNKSNKLWVKFTKKIINISDGVCFVVPVSLMISESNQISEIRKYMVEKNNIFNLTKINIFNVGEKVVFFTTQKGEKNSLIIFPDETKRTINNSEIVSRLPIDKNDDLKISIIKKIELHKNRNEYVYDFNPGSNQTTPERLKNKGLISYTQDDVFKYKVHHSASKILYSKVLYSEYSKDNKTTYGKLKVILNYSGGFVGDKYMFLSKDLIGKQMVGILVDSEEIGKNIIEIYSSKIFDWYIKSEKSGGFNTGIFKLPKVDFSIKWSNQDLYEYFNLTQEEIDLIEKTIKD